MRGFDVERKDIEEISVVYLKGYLDAHTAPDFEGALQTLVDEERFRSIRGPAQRPRRIACRGIASPPSPT